jgi:hypothetical protein
MVLIYLILYNTVNAIGHDKIYDVLFMILIKTSVSHRFMMFYYLCFKRCNDDIIHFNCQREALRTVIPKLFCMLVPSRELIKIMMPRLGATSPIKLGCLEVEARQSGIFLNIQVSSRYSIV